MRRLFGAYVMVDWSAASKPKTGKDSVWSGMAKRDVRFRLTFEAFNPPTRVAAEAQLRAVLADLRRRGDRALVGFDFPLGFPEGTAAALKVGGEAPWRATWALLDKHVRDRADNANNRFAVANTLNRLMTGQAKPFWGAPRSEAQTWLSPLKPAPDSTLPAQFRRTELATQGRGKAGAKSMWQLYGAGTVGGQAIMGMPAVKRLVDELGPKAGVWPFTTGWRALEAEDLAGLEVLVVEIYPSALELKPAPGEVADQAQVRELAEHFAKLDESGRLGAAFAPPKGTTPEALAAVEREEGWILGV